MPECDKTLSMNSCQLIKYHQQILDATIILRKISTTLLVILLIKCSPKKNEQTELKFSPLQLTHISLASKANRIALDATLQIVASHLGLFFLLT